MRRDPFAFTVCFFVVAVAMWFLFVFASWGADRICFDEETASRMVVELESSRIMVKELEQCQGIIDSQSVAMNAWKESSRLFKEKALLAEDRAKKMEELHKIQSKAFEQAIEDARPSIWEEIGKAAAFIGVGVLIGLLAL